MYNNKIVTEIEQLNTGIVKSNKEKVEQLNEATIEISTINNNINTYLESEKELENELDLFNVKLIKLKQSEVSLRKSLNKIISNL